MNAQVEQKTDIVVSKTTTALAVVTHSIEEINSFETQIAELESKYEKLVFDVKTSKGMREAAAALAEIRKPRYALQNLEKAAKQPLNGLKDAITAQTAAMVDRIKAIEDPIEEAATNEKNRLHDEAVAAATKERERVEALEARLETLSLMPFDAQGLTSVQCLACLDEAKAIKIGEDWQEFAERAERTKIAVVAALDGMVAKAVAAEAEAARVIAERAELEQLRAKQAAADQAERERQAKEAAIVAEQQRQNAIKLAAEKSDMDRIEAERAAKAKAESDKLEQDRQDFIREQERQRQAIREESRINNIGFRAHQDRMTPEQKEVLQKLSDADPLADVYSLVMPVVEPEIVLHEEPPALELVPQQSTIIRPTNDAICVCVSDHFGVSYDTAQLWLLDFTLDA